MPASTTTNVFSWPLLDVEDAGQQRRRTPATSDRPGSSTRVSGSFSTAGRTAAARRRGIGHAPAVVAHAQPPPRSIVRSGKPSSSELPAEAGQGPRRRGQRLEVGDLRADVALQAHDLARPARSRARRRISAARRDVHAELGLAQAGGDVGVRPRVDVGVDAEGHPGHRSARRGRGADPRDLVLALRVPLADPVLEPEGDLGVGLPHPGEDDPLRAGSRPAAPRAARPPRRCRPPPRGRPAGAGSRRCRWP